MGPGPPATERRLSLDPARESESCVSALCDRVQGGLGESQGWCGVGRGRAVWGVRHRHAGVV